MRWQSRFFWALAAATAVLLLLLLVCQPGVIAGAPSFGMSAPPPAPGGFLDSIPATHAPQWQGDPIALALCCLCCALLLMTAASAYTPEQRSQRLAWADYAPLHRRPPPPLRIIS